MPTMWMPGVCFACARYIAPNLPAPINATRSGVPAAARCCSMRWRFMAWSRDATRARPAPRARRAARGRAAPGARAGRPLDAPRGDAEPGGGVDVDRVVVDEQHVLGARAECIEN